MTVSPTLRGTPQSASGSITDGSYLEVAKPTGVVAGDQLIIYVVWDNDQMLASLSGFTAGPGVAPLSQKTFSRVADGSEDSVFFVYFNDGFGDTTSTIAWCVAAHGQGTYFDPAGLPTPARATAATTVTSNTLTTVVPGDLLVWFGQCSSGGAITVPSGFSAAAPQVSFGFGTICATTTQTTPGTTTGVGSVASATITGAVLIAIPPAGFATTMAVACGTALAPHAALSYGASIPVERPASAEAASPPVTGFAAISLMEPAASGAGSVPSPAVYTNVYGYTATLAQPASDDGSVLRPAFSTDVVVPSGVIEAVYGFPDVAADTLRAYAALGPIPSLVDQYGRADADLNWPLLRWLDGTGQLLQRVDDLARTDPATGAPGWSLLLDVDRCPTFALPWLAQLVGVRFDLTQNTDATQRQAIRDEQGFRRGSVPTVQAAVNKYLQPGTTAIIVERDTSPYHFRVIVDTATIAGGTFGDSTVNWPTFAARTATKGTFGTPFYPMAKITDAVNAAKPGGLLATVIAIAGPTFGQTAAAFATFADRLAALPTFADVPTFTP